MSQILILSQVLEHLPALRMPWQQAYWWKNNSKWSVTLSINSSWGVADARNLLSPLMLPLPGLLPKRNRHSLSSTIPCSRSRQIRNRLLRLLTLKMSGIISSRFLSRIQISFRKQWVIPEIAWWWEAAPFSIQIWPVPQEGTSLKILIRSAPLTWTQVNFWSWSRETEGMRTWT